METINLCIDTGNTSIKAGVFIDNLLKEKLLFNSYDELVKWADSRLFNRIIVSSVKGDEDLLVKMLKVKKVFVFDYTMNSPVINLYKTPQTLGKDRLASVIGASSVFPGRNCLVIDAGTCITYDILDSEQNYHGGAISPGLNMRFKALNTFTAKLPLLSPETDTPFTGFDTHSSIISGVQNGTVYEINMIIAEYSDKYSDLQVILCGGDSDFFESKIKGAIFAFPDLVLVGLNHTLLYNAHI